MPTINPLGTTYVPQAQSLPAANVNPLHQAADLSPVAKAQLQALNQSRGVAGAEGANFEAMLKGFVNQVNAKQQASVEAVNGVLSGEGVPLHQAVIAMEEAGVAFQMMVEVRNRLLESYQEIMRMQV